MVNGHIASQGLGEAAETARAAIRSLEAAEVASGDSTLAEARRLVDTIDAKSAAAALTTIMWAAKNCDAEALRAVKAAERSVRDVVVFLCRSLAELGDRGSFLEATVRPRQLRI